VLQRHRIAIIPARGGSKRLPRKNVLDFFGKPMIAWTIEAARDSGLFERIFVSTDDPEIAELSRRHGADVPFLRQGLADDFAPVSAVTAAALEDIAEKLDESYQVVAQLMANCPLRGADDIRSALRAFEANSLDFQISCVRYGWLNPWWALRRADDGKGSFLFPDAAAQRSQDLHELFCPTGAIWIARTTALLRHRDFYGPDHRFEPLPWQTGVDIDDKDDLDLARAIFTATNAGSRGAR
jgi:N-acylneuraminate cytidylyltransferase